MDMLSLVKVKRNPRIPDIAPGDTVRVSAKIVEGGKERIQVFQGVVIKIRHRGANASFTVRHVAYGIGVERTFLMYSPLVEGVEIVRHGRVRRSKLYYLRGLSGKAARRKIKRVERKVKEIGEELLEMEPEDVLESEEVIQEEIETVNEEDRTSEEVPLDEKKEESDLVAEEDVEPEESLDESKVIHEEPNSDSEAGYVIEEENTVAIEDSEEHEFVAEVKEEAESTTEPAEDKKQDN